MILSISTNKLAINIILAVTQFANLCLCLLRAFYLLLSWLAARVVTVRPAN